MKKISILIPIALVAISLAGCVVAPMRPAYVTQPVFVAPPGVVYVGPTYAIPGPGYVWAYHAHYGWGWHHPQYGWHRGWR
jgi:hypothetical protein